MTKLPHFPAAPAISQGWLDRWFTIVVAFKGIDGVLELVGGTALLIISNVTLQDMLTGLANWNFVDSHAALLHAVQAMAHTYTPGTQSYTAVYFLLHGVIKVGLVIALLARRYVLYPYAIGVLVLFMVYQVYRIVTEHQIVFDGSLTIIDAVVVWLTVLEYQRHTKSGLPTT